MSTRQRWVALAATAVVILMVVYPPWLETWQRANTSQVHSPSGYAFIFEPPDKTSSGAGLRVDYGRLALQSVAVAGLAAILCLLPAGFVAMRPVVVLFWLVCISLGAAGGYGVAAVVFAAENTRLRESIEEARAEIPPRWQQAPLVKMREPTRDELIEEALRRGLISGRPSRPPRDLLAE